LTPEFAMEKQDVHLQLVEPERALRNRHPGIQAVKEKLLAQLTNFEPFHFRGDANYENRGELLLMHEHRGVDSAPTTRAKPWLAWRAFGSARFRWPRKSTAKKAVLRFDGKEHGVRHDAP